MNSPHPTLPLSGGWRFVPLFTMLGIAAFMTISWMMPEPRTSWDALDLVIFRSLNIDKLLGDSGSIFTVFAPS
ncbi:MAG: hypothetical protein AAF497_12540, partial [Planctomycetota bacterium]